MTRHTGCATDEGFVWSFLRNEATSGHVYVLERLVGRLKRSRRIATWFEKRACDYEAMVTIACVMEWL
ncbi:hypothetical protein GCM10008949_20410 [Deinococcus humi]|nr:hypothetical protein GCM10008949_20410 [Deinococcus humi]